MKKLFSVRTIILAGSLLLQLNTLCFQSRGAAGDVDLSFDPGSSVTNPVSVVVQPDGKALIGGYFGTPSVRLNTDGNRDSTFIASSFNPNMSVFGTDYSFVTPTSALVQSDGRVLVSVTTWTLKVVDVEGDTDWFVDYFLIRFNADASLDSSFNQGTGIAANSLAQQPDGKIVVGDGPFRLNADGSMDHSFNSGTGANGTVNSVVVQSDGKVLVGGNFTTVNGTNRNNIARLNANGSLDSSFNSGTGANGRVSSIAVESDGKVLIGGLFTSVNGTNRNNIARLNANGSLDSSFNPGTGPDAAVLSIALQPDGNVLIGGDFNIVNGEARPFIARLYGDSAVPSLNIARSNASVIVSWPSPSTGFVLQQNTNLTGANWTTPSETVSDNGTTKSISVSPAQGTCCFRLINP